MDLLEGARFSVASHGVAAAYTGWLLRQLGADVHHATALDLGGIGLFLGEGAAFASEPGFAGPGPLITDAPVNADTRALIEREAARRSVTWITPYGLDGEWAERPATDLCYQAIGGWMSAVGDPGKEPLGPPGAQARFTAGIFAAIDALGRAPAPGLTVVSIAESVVATTIYDSVTFQQYGVVRQRVGNRFGRAQTTLVTLPCAEGYVGIHAALHPQWLRLCALIGHPELPHDPRFAALLDRIENIEALDSYLAPWAASRTNWEAYHELQRARVPAAAMPTIAEVLASPQLAARGSWRELIAPAGETVRVPGPPARVTATGSETPAATPRERGPWADGAVRVVDLSMGWAGPFVTNILAAYGADVIKVESHRHFDWWRGSRPAAEGQGDVMYEKSPVFNAANRGKRGITLDLTTPAGQGLARQLIATADLVVENFGAGVMEKLGLSYGEVSRDNPRLVMLRQPGFGSTGPEATYQSFGNTIEGMSGLSSLIGYEGGPPSMMSNAFGDPISGITGTVIALAGLAARAADGRGRCIEASQLEGFLPLVSEAILAFQATGEVAPRVANRRAGSEPSGLYPCAGDDQWVAIEVTSDGEWQRAAALIGEPWAREAGLATAAGRAATRGELHQRLCAWAATRDRDATAAALLATGVAAAPLHNEAELLANEPFASSGFWAGGERAYTGFHLYPTLPISRDGVRPTTGRPAPTLGEHNNDILAALGLDRNAIAALRDDGVIGEIPG